MLQVTDRILKRFPEVDHVLGKAGRAETATDPAPLSMLETVIVLKPRSEWRHVDTWYSSWAPGFVKTVLAPFQSRHDLFRGTIRLMDESLKVPGLTNAWTMPIRGRIDMLTTGMRTPVGLKISGADLATIEQIGTRIESLLPRVKGTRGVFAERTGTGYFLNFEWNREQLARYGLSIEDAQLAVENAIGGENVTTVIQGRERYPVNVRYMRDFRSDSGCLQRVLVPAGGQRQIALGELAQIRTSSGPAMIRDENGMLTGYVYVDVAGRDPRSYVNEAGALLRDQVKAAAGILYLVERTVRSDGAREAAPDARCAAHAGSSSCSCSTATRVRLTKDNDHPFGGAVFRRGRDLVPLPRWLQHECWRLGGVDCPAGHRR